MVPFLSLLPFDAGDGDPEAFAAIKPGWIPFLITLAMLAILVFLYFSMRKQLRRIRFDEQPKSSDAPSPKH